MRLCPNDIMLKGDIAHCRDGSLMIIEGLAGTEVGRFCEEGEWVERPLRRWRLERANNKTILFLDDIMYGTLNGHISMWQPVIDILNQNYAFPSVTVEVC